MSTSIWRPSSQTLQSSFYVSLKIWMFSFLYISDLDNTNRQSDLAMKHFRIPNAFFWSTETMFNESSLPGPYPTTMAPVARAVDKLDSLLFTCHYRAGAGKGARWKLQETNMKRKTAFVGPWEKEKTIAQCCVIYTPNCNNVIQKRKKE